MRRHLTLPNILATLLLFAALAATAPAARRTVTKLVTGKTVKDGSLTGADVKNGSLSARKLARGVTRQGAPGATGAKGATGDKGAAGEAGAQGAKGAPGTFRSSADARDLYAWVTDSTHDHVNIVATFGLSQHSEQPHEPIRFDDDLLYEIHVARGASSLADVVTYQLRFTTNTPAQAANGGGVLNQALQPVTQTYTLRRKVGGVEGPVLGPFTVAPPRLGTHVDANRGITYNDAYAATFANTTGSPAVKLWAGPRDEPAFADVGGMKDLFNFSVPGFDSFVKHDVMAVALEVPTTQLTVDGNPPTTAGTSNLLGVWSSTSRLLDGTFTQVSRTSQPMLDDLMIPASEQAEWGAAKPSDDLALAGDRLVNPLLVNELSQIGYYGAHAIDPTPFRHNRTDILDVFTAKNVPSVNVHAGVPASTMLRLDPAVNSSWPNGRKLIDDTTDGMLSVIATENTAPVTDNVNANDYPFLSAFPWVTLPTRPTE